MNSKQGQILQPGAGVNCELLFKTSDYFFLKKGCRVHSVALDFSETNSVANWLISLDEDQREISFPLEAGLLHRLDFETSGVMVAARNKRAFDWLKKKFREKKVYKEYVCLIDKKLQKKGWLSAYAQNHPRSKKRILISFKRSSSKQTEIKMKVLDQKKQDKGYCLRIQLVTGYRHQIRAHLAFLGCPIVGDSLYGGVKAQRLMLFASEIKFEDQQGKILSVKCSYE